jgi:hypothetical protein
MNKIRLELERLQVETFETAAADGERGTVHGHWSQAGTCDARAATCQYGGTCGPAAAPSRPARSTSNVRRMESAAAGTLRGCALTWTQKWGEETVDRHPLLARLSFRHLRRRAVGCSQAPTRVAADGPSAAVPAARYEPYGGRLRMRACQSRSICCW